MYLSLYRKYRPQTFADVISQPHITRTLQNQIAAGKPAHAYLFTGSRGTGKTTCAKVLAKGLNCLAPIGGDPCLTCEACRLIEKGTPDIVEMDAASHNGVDDVRTLRDEIIYSPVHCKKRVYIIDEVHMLSPSAFNALLKTLEEPPAHVVFILATTEKHKIPATILSRCQRFEFRRIDMEESADLLLRIAQKEGFSLDKNAALLIARLSDGGMRDALSLLDTCCASSDTVNADVVRECAGVAGRGHLFGIAEAVLSADPAAALDIVGELHAHSKDLGRLVDELIYLYRTLMLMKAAPGNARLTAMLPEEQEEYTACAARHTLPQIMRCLSVLSECFEKMSRARERRILVEMCVTRLCSPTLDPDVDKLLMRLAALEQQLVHAPGSGVNVPVSSSGVNVPASSVNNPHLPPSSAPISPSAGIAHLSAPSAPPPTPAENVHVTPAPMNVHTPTENMNIPTDIPLFPNEITAPAEDVPLAADVPPPPIDLPFDLDEPPLPEEPPDIEPEREQIPPQIPASEPEQAQIPTAENTFRQWGEVLNLLSPYLAGMLEGETVTLEGEQIVISGGEFTGSILENPDNRALLTHAIAQVTGKPLEIVFRPAPEKKPEDDKVEAFFAQLAEWDIEIKHK